MYLTKRIIRSKIAAGGEVWLNAISGAVDRLGEADLAAIGELKDGKGRPSDGLHEQLARRGYLYTDRESEQVVFRNLVNANLEVTRSRPVSLVTCPTYACNLRCVYCFERHLRRPGRQTVMKVEAVEYLFAAFRQIMAAGGSRPYSLGLFGGEPLLPGAHSFVSRLLEVAGRELLPVNIVTNGVHVADFMALLQAHKSHLDSVQITLDGPRDVHDRRRPGPGGAGSYEAIVTAIDRLLDVGIHVFLRVNFDVTTVSQLPRLAEIMKQRAWMGAPGFTCSLAPIQDHTGTGLIPNAGPNDHLLDALLDIYDQNPECEEIFGLRGFPVIAQVSACLADQVAAPRVSHCEANQGGFWLAGPEGLLYACPETIGQPELAIGRFMPEFEVFDERRQQWAERSILSLDRCSECKLATLCGGGCTYAALVRHGHVRSPVCEENLEASVKIFLSRRAARN